MGQKDISWVGFHSATSFENIFGLYNLLDIWLSHLETAEMQ